MQDNDALDEQEIEDMLATMMAPIKMPDNNQDVKTSRESRRNRRDELRKHFASYGTEEEARTDPEGIKLTGHTIALLVRAKELPIFDALEKMAATLGENRETLIWRAIEEFVFPLREKKTNMTTTSIAEVAEALGIPKKDLEYLCKKAEQNFGDIAKALAGEDVPPPNDDTGLEYLSKQLEQNIFSLPEALPRENMPPSPPLPNGNDILSQNEIEALLEQMSVGVNHMTDYRREFNGLIWKVFSALGKEAVLGKGIDHIRFETVVREAPHDIPKLPDGKMGVYAFLYNDRFLKIGKAGQNSKPRFSSHHYNPKSSPSTLAASLLADKKMSRHCKISEVNVKDWIMQNCTRVDVIIDAELGIFALELIEAVLHYWYEPKYEGVSSQRK